MVEFPTAVKSYIEKGGQCFSCGKPWIYDDFLAIYYCEECDTILARLPGSRTYMLLGDTGTGKTVLINKMLDIYLKNKRPCIYVAFDEHPTQLREFMNKYIRNLGEHEANGLMTFFDCYSCSAGIQSQEKYSVKSPGDLNGLNLQLTTILSQSPANPVLCIDSLTKAFIYCESDTVLKFVSTLSAKLKIRGGALFFTLASGIVSSETQKRLEQLADGVIELKVTESGGKQLRQFRVSKIRGALYYEKWLPFYVGKSSIFLSVPTEKEELERFNAIFKLLSE